MTAPAIQPAEPGDLDDFLRLLAGAGLPEAGARDHFPRAFLVARDPGGEMIGAAGVEVYGSAGLLRSVAVRDDQRGTGLGQRLTRAALELAAERGVRRLYLLTTTAADFFPRLGFTRVERAMLPAGLNASAQLQGACCASAVAMRLDLPD